MKLYRVSLEVQITEIGPLEDSKPSLRDELSQLEQRGKPIEAIGAMMDRLQMGPGGTAVFTLPESKDHVAMRRSTTICAETPEEAQAVLGRFNETLRGLETFGFSEAKKTE